MYRHKLCYKGKGFSVIDLVFLLKPLNYETSFEAATTIGIAL